MKKVCVIGCGRLGSIIADAVSNGKVPGVTLAGVFGRTYTKACRLAQKTNGKAFENLEQLLQEKPDYVVEAAGSDAVYSYGEQIILAGAELIVLSTGAFADVCFRERISRIVLEKGSHIYLAPGVIGGTDLLTAAALMGNVETTFTKTKYSVQSGKGDPALKTLIDSFSGTVAEAYARFPEHLNVAVTAALATNGIDQTQAVIKSGDEVSFQIDCKGQFGKAHFYSSLGTMSPELAAWSCVAILKRLTEPISF